MKARGVCTIALGVQVLIVDVSSSGVAALQTTPEVYHIGNAIRQQWTGWRSRIATIEFTERNWNRPLIEQRHPETESLPLDEFVERWTRRMRWRWSDSGAWQRQIEHLEDGIVVERSMSGSDTRTGYSATSQRGIEGLINWQVIQFQVPSRGSLGMRALRGLRTVPGLWLSDDPKSPNIIWKKDESWDGNACARFSVTIESNGPVNVEFWIDRQYNSLPRRMVMEFRSPHAHYDHEYQVTEFAEVAPGFWMPARGFHGEPEVTDNWYSWSIEQAALNSLTPVDFAPPQPNRETVVKDEHGMRLPHRTSRFDGIQGDEPQDHSAGSEQDEPVTTSPRTDGSRAFLAISCVVALIIGLWLRKRG